MVSKSLGLEPRGDEGVQGCGILRDREGSAAGLRNTDVDEEPLYDPVSVKHLLELELVTLRAPARRVKPKLTCC